MVLIKTNISGYSANFQTEMYSEASYTPVCRLR